MGKISILGAILAAILDFRHIGFSEEVKIVKFEFLDPENLGVDILQAIFNAHCSSYFQKNAFWRHIGRHFEKWRVATLGGCSILIKFFWVHTSSNLTIYPKSGEIGTPSWFLCHPNVGTSLSNGYFLLSYDVIARFMTSLYCNKGKNRVFFRWL